MQTAPSVEAKAGSEHATYLVADDHPLFLDYFSDLLAAVAPDRRIAKARSFESLVARLSGDATIDLAFIDLSMPDVRGLFGLLYLTARFPRIRFVVVSGRSGHRTIEACLALGAHAFIAKSLEEDDVIEAVLAVARGEVWPTSATARPSAFDEEEVRLLQGIGSLTPQEVRAYTLLCEGRVDKEIARALKVAPSTAKAHVAAILSKLGVFTRTQAVIAAFRLGVEEEVEPPLALA